MSEGDRALIGRTLGGRFRVTGFLGEGAMAAVYRAEQDGEPREVAVKVAHRELLRDPTFAKRFTREAKAASKIVHRNTVRIIEHGADGDYLYLAMELLVGQDLFDTLAQRRRLPEARAVEIMIQVCAALEAAHAQNIVHRDLKPENVFLVGDPEAPGGDLVKVLDFGIAKVMERERKHEDAPPSSEPVSSPPSSVLTRVGTIVGTPEYMSPEQAMGLTVDARSDVYACGVLLFHMITGRAPFVGATPIEVILQLPDRAPPAPSSLQPGLHPFLEKLIMKALDKLPENRPQTARELRTDLEELLPDLSTSSKPTAAAASPASAPKVADLPGVPGAVSISVDSKRPRGDGDEAPATVRSTAELAAAAKKKADEEATAKKKRADEEAAAQKKADEEAAAKKAEEDAVAKRAEEALAAKRAEEEAAAKKKVEEEAAAKKKADEEAAAKKRADEAAKKTEEEADAKRKADEKAAAKKDAEAAAKKDEVDAEPASHTARRAEGAEPPAKLDEDAAPVFAALAKGDDGQRRWAVILGVIAVIVLLVLIAARR